MCAMFSPWRRSSLKNTQAGRNNVQHADKQQIGGVGGNMDERGETGSLLLFATAEKAGARLPGAECCLKMLRPQPFGKVDAGRLQT